MPELGSLPSLCSRASVSFSLSLSLDHLSCSRLILLLLSVYLSLSLYLFAISLCASPRRVLTANNAPRDALENIHFSCRGDGKERRRQRGREDRAASHAGSEIYFRETESSQRTDSGAPSTVALEFSGCLARSRGATPGFDLSVPNARWTRGIVQSTVSLQGIAYILILQVL